MKKWSVSWHAHAFVGFTLTSPWWVSVPSGVCPPSETARHPARDVVITAAVIADTEAEAKQVIVAAHDATVKIDWRFVARQGKYWTPFQERYPRAPWMQWPAPEARL